MEHPPVYLFLLLGIPEHFQEQYRYVMLSVLVTLILTVISLWAKKNLQEIPSGKQNFFEFVIDGIVEFMEEVMGDEAKKFLPLIGSLAFFILTSNILGLIPGFDSPTANINVTGGCAIVVFFTTHIVGIKRHGINYIKQFTGPIVWLIPLMLPIEIISHLVRPVSLSVRLFGNIFGGHLVIASFLGLISIPLIYPVPMMAMEIFVAFVQTLIFIVLSMIYISLALSEEH